jgi:uncharacterized protein (TIGR00730 family)
MSDRTLHSVCVFCGSRMGARPAYVEGARALGEAIASRGLRLVYGGTSIGLMGVLADAALGRGGKVVGVLPRGLEEREIAHRGLTELHVVGSMHERKALMAKLSDAFIAMPGGFGTWDELFEIITWAQLGLHAKPMGVLNVEGYFEPMLAMIRQAASEGFIHHAPATHLLAEAAPGALLDGLLARR